MSQSGMAKALESGHTPLPPFMLGETSLYPLLPMASSLPSGMPAQSRHHLVGPQAQARVYMQAVGFPGHASLAHVITVFCQSFVSWVGGWGK